MDTTMPGETNNIKLHMNDVPWTTAYLKHPRKCCQKALKDNCPPQFCHNQVNKESKHFNMLKPNIYEAHVKDLKNTKPRKWLSDF